LRIEKDCGVFRCIFLFSQKSETRDRKPVPSKDSHEDWASFNFPHRPPYGLYPQRREIIPLALGHRCKREADFCWWGDNAMNPITRGSAHGDTVSHGFFSEHESSGLASSLLCRGRMLGILGSAERAQSVEHRIQCHGLRSLHTLLVGNL